MEKQIDIDGLELNYSETGRPSGRPVILMHGWGCNHTTVASIASILEPGLRVFSLDLPGHGKTPEPPAIWGVEEYTRLVEKFIAALGLKNVTLIGHSFGGRISLLLSSRNDYVKNVVLVDAAGIKNPLPLKKRLRIMTYKLVKKTFTPIRLICGKEQGEKIVNTIRGKFGSADYRNASPMMRAILSKCVNEDLKHVMPSIKSPTLLIWGADDTATPLSDAKTMERLIPDAGLVSFEGCGHYSFLDNPGGFRAVMREFFKSELKL